MNRFIWLVILLIVLVACSTLTPMPPVSQPTPTNVPAATNAPTSTRTLTPTALPTVMQYTLTLNEEDLNTIVDNAMSPSVIAYADSATVKLQNGQAAISANYYPTNVKPSIAKMVLTADATNCNLRVSVVGATLGYSAMPEYQQALLAQALERLLTRQVAQQRAYTCVDSIGIANGTMTIKYR